MKNNIYIKERVLNEGKLYEKILYFIFKMICVFVSLNAIIFYAFNLPSLFLSYLISIIAISAFIWLTYYYINFIKYNFNSITLNEDSNIAIKGNIWNKNYHFNINLNDSEISYKEIVQFGNSTLLFLTIKFKKQILIKDKLFKEITICNGSLTKRDISDICRELFKQNYKFKSSIVYFHFIPFGKVNHNDLDEDIYYLNDT